MEKFTLIAATVMAVTLLGFAIFYSLRGDK